MLAGEVISELWPPPPPSLLPDGLEDMPPGPELSRVLAGIDLDSLPGFDLVVVMRAHARQVSHHQAELLGLVARVADASSEASALVSDDDGEFAADEIRAALCLTRRAAVSLLQLARDLERLPDWPRRSAPGRSTSPGPGWCPPRWPPWTTRRPKRWSRWCWSVLLRRPPVSWRRRVRRLVLAVDPASAKERYEKGMKSPGGALTRTHRTNLCLVLWDEGDMVYHLDSCMSLRQSTATRVPRTPAQVRVAFERWYGATNGPGEQVVWISGTCHLVQVTCGADRGELVSCCPPQPGGCRQAWWRLVEEPDPP